MKVIFDLIKILELEIDYYYEIGKFSSGSIYELMRMELRVLRSELTFGLDKSMLIKLKYLRRLLLDAGIINSNVYKLEQEINFHRINFLKQC